MRILTGADVLKLIDPADPDTIYPNQDGTFVMTWIAPVPPMDVYALRVTPGVEIIQEFEPENLPGALRVIIRIKEEN